MWISTFCEYSDTEQYKINSCSFCDSRFVFIYLPNLFVVVDNTHGKSAEMQRVVTGMQSFKNVIWNKKYIWHQLQSNRNAAYNLNLHFKFEFPRCEVVSWIVQFLTWFHSKYLKHTEYKNIPWGHETDSPLKLPKCLLLLSLIGLWLNMVSGDFVPGRIRTQENSYPKWMGTNSLVNSYLGTNYLENSYPTYNFHFYYIMCKFTHPSLIRYWHFL